MSKYGEPWKVYPIVISSGVHHGVIETRDKKSKYKTELSGDVPLLERAAQCVNACAGLDMSGVPEGAVRELVNSLNAAIEDSGHASWCSGWHGPTDIGEGWMVEAECTCWVKDAKATIAPFVKED